MLPLLLAYSGLLADIRPYLVISGHKSSVSSAAFSPDSKFIATAGFDSQIRVTEVKNCRMRLNMIHCAMVECVAYSPDGKHIASAASGINFP